MNKPGMSFKKIFKNPLIRLRGPSRKFCKKSTTKVQMSLLEEYLKHSKKKKLLMSLKNLKIRDGINELVCGVFQENSIKIHH